MNTLVKNLVLNGIVGTTLALSAGVAFGEQTAGEKAKDGMNDAGRAVTKKVHRAKEKMCAKGDAKCAADKVKNRTNEATDATKDKATELKDKVD